MKGTQVPEYEMKDSRTAHPLAPASPSTILWPLLSRLRSFQLEDSLGTKDPATGMILIEYDYLPSSSDSHVRAPFSRESPQARVRHAANRARGNFLLDE